MKVISVIEDEDVIKKILKHLGLWELKARPPPRANALPKAPEYYIDYTDSQVPASDKWLYVDPQYPEVYSPFFSSIHYLIDTSDVSPSKVSILSPVLTFFDGPIFNTCV